MHKLDVVIFGAGIAGLWTLARLTQQGYNAVLLETDAIGSGQTIKSQGIIHGGLKYALTGHLSGAVTSLQDMPTIWQQCLNGTGEIDLSAARVLSDGQFMWSANKITGGITTLFASNSLKSHVATISKANWPLAIRDALITSKLYKLEEMVLDIKSVLQAIVAPVIKRCIKIDSNDGYKLEIDKDNNIKNVKIKTNNVSLSLHAQRYIFTAGSGNEVLSSEFTDSPTMQLRPLQMVMVKSRNLPPLYGHCLGLGVTPRLTITTHIAKDHTPVWYLGGKIAEDGVKKTSKQLIDFAKQELATLFPKLDLTTAEYATFFVDRAEAAQANGSKPNSTTIFNSNNHITAWPTKLAFAPLLAQQILNTLKESNITPKFEEQSLSTHNLPTPAIALPIWDQLL
jgi:hypothetical protein